MNNSSARVAITGLGAVTPIGVGASNFWQNCVSGKLGAGPITRFDASRFPVQVACEVGEFNKSKSGALERRASRFSLFALAAARQAIEDAKLNLQHEDLTRTGVIVGNATGDIQPIVDQVQAVVETGDYHVDPVAGLRVLPYSSAIVLSVAFGLRGYVSTTVCACSAGTQAIGEAARVIARGEADVMLAGGAEAWIHPLPLASFHSLGVMSGAESPTLAKCRPFDARRDGFVPGEGSGFLVLESHAHASRRGARVYGEVAGYAVTADGSHLTTPRRDGAEAARCMRLALQDAGVDENSVDYVNAHGTATRIGDIAETKAIKTVLGSRAGLVPVSATKSMIGHLLGAAGAVEVVACVKTLETQVVHPTVNLQQSDPECDLDYVPEGPRHVDVRTVIKNSFALGGQNVTLVLTRCT